MDKKSFAARDPIPFQQAISDRQVLRLVAKMHEEVQSGTQVLRLIANMHEEVQSGCPSGKIYGEALSLALTSYLLARDPGAVHVERVETIERIEGVQPGRPEKAQRTGRAEIERPKAIQRIEQVERPAQVERVEVGRPETVERVEVARPDLKPSNESKFSGLKPSNGSKSRDRRLLNGWSWSGQKPPNESKFSGLETVERLEIARPEAVERIEVLRRSGITFSHAQAARLHDFMQANLTRDIALSELADLVGLSAHYFSFLFKNTFLVTPHHYLLRERIHEGQKLLASGRLSICEVALKLGFSDQSHFTHVFRKVTGITPRRYQRSC